MRMDEKVWPSTVDNELKYNVKVFLAGSLSCKEIAEAITDYLEGALPIGHRIRFHMHLGMCVGCRNYLKQMKYTIQTLGKLPSEPIPPEVKDELVRRFRNWKKG